MLQNTVESPSFILFTGFGVTSFIFIVGCLYLVAKIMKFKEPTLKKTIIVSSYSISLIILGYLLLSSIKVFNEGMSYLVAFYFSVPFLLVFFLTGSSTGFRTIYKESWKKSTLAALLATTLLLLINSILGPYLFVLIFGFIEFLSA